MNKDLSEFARDVKEGDLVRIHLADGEYVGFLIHTTFGEFSPISSKLNSITVNRFPSSDRFSVILNLRTGYLDIYRVSPEGYEVLRRNNPRERTRSAALSSDVLDNPLVQDLNLKIL